jgi:signal transduction histidine kinase
MKSIQDNNGAGNNGSNPEPQSFWERCDKWFHEHTFMSEFVTKILKFTLISIILFYAATVCFRIWLIWTIYSTFSADIIGVLPLAPKTATLIYKGLNILILFSPDVIIGYVLFNRRVRAWRLWVAAIFILAVFGSWWATHDPGVKTHCYLKTTDRGLIVSYADENGKCGVDKETQLQMQPVTNEILPSIRNFKRGINPHRIEVSNINADEMFDSGSGRSKYWINEDYANNFTIYDGPGFDQATQSLLIPVEPKNVEKIRQLVKKQQAMLKEAAEEREAEQKRVQAEQEEAQRKQAEEAEQKRVQAEQEEAQRKQAEEKERERLGEEQNRVALERQQPDQYARAQQAPQVYLTITNLDCYSSDYYMNNQLVATVQPNSSAQLAVRAGTYTTRACLPGTSNCGSDTIYTISGTYNVTITRSPACQSANVYGYVNNRLAQPVMRVIPMWSVRRAPIWRR